jgi:uncharacterized protein (DUF2062 family)
LCEAGAQIQQIRVEDVQLIDSLMLVCAVLASLASGVLVAYGVCLTMFGIFRIHARQVAEKPAARVAGSTSIVEG